MSKMSSFVKSYLALGGNVGDVKDTFLRSIELIDKKVGPVFAVSSFHLTRALNHPDHKDLKQPDYLNAVVECHVNCTPSEILECIQKIESELGRKRETEVRWGPRCIDIDILLYGDEVIESEVLKVPHPEMHCRCFVLSPLNEIAADIYHPLTGVKIGQILNSLPRDTIQSR